MKDFFDKLDYELISIKVVDHSKYPMNINFYRKLCTWF